MFTKPMRETLIIYARINAHLSRTFLSSMDRGISSRLKRVIQINALFKQLFWLVLENIGLVLFLECFWTSRAVQSMNLQKKYSTNKYLTNADLTLVQWHISVNRSCTLKVTFSHTNWSSPSLSIFKRKLLDFLS